MADLSVDLVTPTGMVLEATLLPDDMLTEEAISELVDALGLPRRSPSGETIDYAIEIAGLGAIVEDGKRLRDAGVSTGARLRLVTCGLTSWSLKPYQWAPSHARLIEAHN